MGDYTDAVKLLQKQRQAIANELGKIDVAVRALGGIRTSDFTTGRRKPKFSAAARARIAAAQRKRWRKIKAAQKAAA